jgi:hypothetical protein
MVQITRYTESPVGPYDGFILVPGQFEYEDSGKKNYKVSRIYVSQEKTCYNGRKSKWMGLLLYYSFSST